MTSEPLQSLEPRRLFAAGDPLETFGHHGEAFTPYELYQAEMSEVKATPDGKLLAGVSSQYYRDTRPGVAADFIRFNADGSPDLTFGGSGHVDSFFTSVRRIAVRSDGKFYALGSTTKPHNNDYGSTAGIEGADDWFVARFLPGGTLDRSFGTRGKVAIQLDRSLVETGGPGESGNASSFLNTDGQFTLLANYKPSSASSDIEPAVFRYDATGRFDPAFNAGQPLRLRSAGDRWTAPSMAVTRDGDFLIAAVRTFRRRDTTVVKRFNADGSPDARFGNTGLVTLATIASSVPTVAVPGDDSVFVAGNQYEYVDGKYKSARNVFKLNFNGTPDVSFSGGSVAIGSFIGFAPLLPLGVSDGGVVLGGSGGSLQRLRADGSIDTAFGTVDNGSRRPVVINNTVYAITADPMYQVNKRGVAVYRHAVTALSLGGNGVAPITLANKHLTLTGTSDSESIDIDSEPAFASPSGVQLTLRRGFWARTVPVSAVTSIDVYGEGGNDDIRAFMDDVTGVAVVLHGGSGNDAMAGYGSNIRAYGDAGEDGVYGDISVDRDFP